MQRNDRVILVTNLGTITIELYNELAPKTVENFKRYVVEGHYANTIFHRTIKNFMIQGGGFEPGFKQKPTHPPIQCEANNGLKNDKYTIAMARTNAPHSATAQFFINVVDNNFLNFTAPVPAGWGYAVFGKVIDGTHVVDQIAQTKTGSHGFHQDVPVQDVVIQRAFYWENLIMAETMRLPSGEPSAEYWDGVLKSIQRRINDGQTEQRWYANTAVPAFSDPKDPVAASKDIAAALASGQMRAVEVVKNDGNESNWMKRVADRDPATIAAIANQSNTRYLTPEQKLAPPPEPTDTELVESVVETTTALLIDLLPGEDAEKIFEQIKAVLGNRRGSVVENIHIHDVHQVIQRTNNLPKE